MSASRKVFRIETTARGGSSGDAETEAARRHVELLAEIRALRGRTARAPEEASPQTAALEAYRRSFVEAQKLKAELDAITEAIERTKREIVTLHRRSVNGAEFARVSHELDAIVLGTEQATETILASAEAIDDHAATLAAKLSGDDQGIASDIQERVIAVFEACNFQDLTGQRIGKIVGTLRFVEQRIGRMMEIWGGMQKFVGVEPVPLAERGDDRALLNGPALADDADVASQADIDALFA